MDNNLNFIAIQQNLKDDLITQKPPPLILSPNSNIATTQNPVPLPNESNINTSIIWYFIFSFCQAWGTFYAKVIFLQFPHVYNIFTFFLFRNIAIVLISYLYSTKTGQLIPPYLKYLTLNGLSFVAIEYSLVFSCFIFLLHYIRCTTSQGIIILIPLVVNGLSILFLSFKPNAMFIIGSIIGIIGIVLIIISELHLSQNIKQLTTGIVFAVLALLTFSSIIITNKKVSWNQINFHIHLYYNHWVSVIYCGIYSLILISRIQLKVSYILCSMLHGWIFFINQYCANQAVNKNKNVKMFSWMNTFQIFYVMILCKFILDEVVTYWDGVGSSIIVIFLIYQSLFYN